MSEDGKMKLTERIPPQNIEAEQSLLGSLLIDKEAVTKIADIVAPEDFYRDANKIIFEAMMELYRRHEPLDILTLSNKLTEKNQLEIIGGRSYLISLSNVVPTASNVTNYATIVQKKATLRRLIEAGGTITGYGFDEMGEVEVLLDKAQQKIFGVSQKFLKQGFTPIDTILESAFNRIDELHKEKGKLRGISTGFFKLDDLLAGLQKSDLIILAARPSVGKTSLALDIARNAAIKTGLPVGVFSLEMSKEQLVDRLICAEAGVDLWRMRTGKLSDASGEYNDFERIGRALGTLAEAPIYIDDSASANVMEIRTRARRLQMEKGLGLLIVDYLQLMESYGNRESRVLEVADITRSLKQIARELNIPVLALSQLSRAVELNKPAIPKLSHLRESGSIEQDADVVMFIYRKTADRGYRAEDISPEEKNIAEIHIAKHRNGPTGIVNLFFDEARVSFKNLESQL